MPAHEIPRCGNCHYVVRGISELRCPECGGDLREVGIDVGTPRRYGSTWVGAIALVLLWGLAVLIATPVLHEAIRIVSPDITDRDVQVRFQKPTSGDYEQIALSVSSTHTNGEPMSDTHRSATLEMLRNDGAIVTLSYDGTRYSYGSAVRTGPLDGPLIAKWIADATALPQSPQFLAEAIEVVSYVTNGGVGSGGSYTSFGSTSGRMFGSIQENSQSVSHESAWVAGSNLFAWALWIVGGAFVVRWATRDVRFRTPPTVEVLEIP